MASVTRTDGENVVTTHGAAKTEQWVPFQPSWVDRLRSQVKKLPFPAWLIYSVLTALIVLLHAAIKWADGSYPPGTFFPFHVCLVVATGLGFLTRHYLEYWGLRSLAEFRPVLIADEAE